MMSNKLIVIGLLLVLPLALFDFINPNGMADPLWVAAISGLAFGFGSVMAGLGILIWWKPMP